MSPKSSYLPYPYQRFKISTDKITTDRIKLFKQTMIKEAIRKYLDNDWMREERN